MRKISLILVVFMIMPFVYGRGFTLVKDPKSIATGITICLKNKKYLEKKHNLPAGSDFVSHLFKVKYRDFEDRFKLLGAEVQFYDYPFIPFDDYYTNDYFGFIRIKVLPENTDRALMLASQLIKEVLNFNNRDFVIATKSVFGSNVMRNRTKEIAKETIWNLYFGDNFVSFPDYMFTPKLGEDKLKAFLKDYLAPSNIYVSIYGNFNEKEVKKALDKCFPDGNKGLVEDKLRVERIEKHKKTVEVNSRQAFVYIVFPVKDSLSVEDYARLRILTSNASDKIAFQIREKEGLAYSIGCYITYKGGHSFFVAYCGTNPKKAEYVSEEMERMVRELMLKPIEFKQKDLVKIKNGIVFSGILKTLPNVNKSFFNALFDMTNYIGYNKNMLDKSVKKEKIKRLCGKYYLDTDNYLNIIFK